MSTNNNFGTKANLQIKRSVWALVAFQLIPFPCYAEANEFLYQLGRIIPGVNATIDKDDLKDRRYKSDCDNYEMRVPDWRQFSSGCNKYLFSKYGEKSDDKKEGIDIESKNKFTDTKRDRSVTLTNNADAIISKPDIFVTDNINVSSADALISGDIKASGKIVSLVVDGSNAPFKSDGHFSFTRVVPIGISQLRLIATDEWGQTAEAQITVNRSIGDSLPDYPKLSPLKLVGVPRPNTVALIIGIEKYEDIPSAEFAERDAQVFYDYATHALGIPSHQVSLLTNAKARRRDIDKAVLTWLKPQIVKGETDVVIFFSGHGLAGEDGDLYLLPIDGDPNLLDRSAVRRKELIDIIVGAGAHSVTLMLDTCYSGLNRGKEALVASARPVRIVAKADTVPNNVSILSASANDQISSSLKQVRHGLFSYYLMKGLEGDASRDRSQITLNDLDAYLTRNIPGAAAKLGRTQTPQLVGDGARVLANW